MKNFEEFVAGVKACVAEAFPDHDVRIQEVTKNNNVTMTGICAFTKGATVTPTLYLDNYYSRYEELADQSGDDRAFRTVSKDIINVLRNEDGTTVKGFNIDEFTKFKNTKDSIYMILVNNKTNDLSDKPHRELVGEYSILYRYNVPVPEGEGYASILVNNQHVKTWGVEEEDLYQAAIANASKITPIVVEDMEHMMSSLLGFPIIEDESYDNSLEHGTWRTNLSLDTPMYVISNTKRYYGAAAIAVPGVLQEIADVFGCNLYIIPSSIHEVIIVPDNGMTDPYSLSIMIREINDSELKPEEVLGYTLMRFDREQGKLMTVSATADPEL